ncbi:MAG TPA: hypothetical protein VK504_16585, partial [Vicinamibacterales bacterium]|nr:hypothetical protein [Vicinamibacterales bacterium]
PSGSRAGTISATLVHNDKVPMTPGFGQQPRFIVTVQPPGVHFDPPAAMTIPNLDGLAPGEVTEMYSFDHDLGQFVAVGTGSASEDGSTIVSDPGVGVIKSGWQSAGNPNPTGNSNNMTINAVADLYASESDDDVPPAVRNGPKAAVDSTGLRAPRASDTVVNTKVTTVGSCARIMAFGLPVTADYSYSGWQIVDDPKDATDDPSAAVFVKSAGCISAPACFAIIQGVKAGVVTVRANYINSTTVKTVSTDVKVRFVNVNASIKQFVATGTSPMIEDTGTAGKAIGNLIWTNTMVQKDVLPMMVTRNDTVTLVATFTLIAPIPVPMPYTRFVATIAGVAEFQGVDTVPAGKTEFTVKLVGGLLGAKQKVVPKSQYLNPASIVWQVRPPNWCSTPAISAGITNVPFYAPLSKPTFPVYRTVAQLATEGTAVAETDTSGLIQKVWSKFAARSVHTWDNRPLKYYPTGTKFGGCGLTEEELLTILNGNGRCGGFAPLLAKALALNGIQATEIDVEPSKFGPAMAGVDGFLVKKWIDNKASLQAPNNLWEFNFETSPGGSSNEMVPAPTLPATYGDLTSLFGVEGQNSFNPSEKAFPNHAIVRVNNRYLDSSYGVEYFGAQSQFESDSIAFYYRKSTQGLPPNFHEARKPGSGTGVGFFPGTTYTPTPPPPPPTPVIYEGREQ